jgi:hypothetical protein
MNYSRRCALVSALAFASIPHALSAKYRGPVRVQFGHLTVFASSGPDLAASVVNDLSRYAQVVGVLTKAEGPIAGVPLNCWLLTGADLRRVRAETDRFTTKVTGNRAVAYLAHRDGQRTALLNGNLDYPDASPARALLYHLTASELRMKSLRQSWYLTAYSALFNGLQFKTSRQLTVGMRPAAAAYAADYGEWLPLREMFAMTLDEALQRSLGLTYMGQAWFLAHYLSFRQPELRAGIERFVSALDQRASVDAAWSDSLDLTFDVFEASLRTYRQSKISAYTYQVQPFTPDASNTAPITESEFDSGLATAIELLRPQLSAR